MDISEYSESEQGLQARGLLPSPYGNCCQAFTADPQENILADILHMDVIRLADRATEERNNKERAFQDLGVMRNRWQHTRKALEWLRDNYELDKLALDVISYAVEDGDYGLPLL